jgi:hypothetical protein
MDADLDVSWITEQQRVQNIQNNYCREPVSDIYIYFLYINNHSSIEKITRKKQPVIDNLIHRDEVLALIQNHKVSVSKKYKLMDVLLYHVDLEPQHIQSYSQTEDVLNSSKPFFKTLPIVDEIHIPTSIFIFHSLNSVFFVYKEVDTGSHNHTIKSILKKQSVICEPTHKHTKKVRISIDEPEYNTPLPRKKKTRKNVVSVST